MYLGWLKHESPTWMRPVTCCKLEAKPWLLVLQMLISIAAGHTGQYLIVLAVVHQLFINLH
jgi:hypothetical protein